MLIDINKKYKTRDGRKTKLVYVGDEGPYPVYGIMYYKSGACVNGTWTKNGIKYIGASDTDCDLVEVEPEVPQQC